MMEVVQAKRHKSCELSVFRAQVTENFDWPVLALSLSLVSYTFFHVFNVHIPHTH